METGTRGSKTLMKGKVLSIEKKFEESADARVVLTLKKIVED